MANLDPDWYPSILQVAKALTNSLEDAEDLAQQSCIEILIQTKDRFDPNRGSLYNWLRSNVFHARARIKLYQSRDKRSAVNISLDRLEADRAGDDHVDVQLQLPSVPPPQEDATFLSEVVALVEHLPYRQQVALWTHVLSDGAIRSQHQHLYLARRQLRDLLR